MKWTEEQLDAINKSGSNIIVSAGAGSGKTAVLTERVIAKLRNGIHINELLILTFTNNAAKEMKSRIKEEIIKIPELREEVKYIDSSDIKTFDAYVLSLIKKYYYHLNLEKNINIIDSSIILLKKKEILNNLLNDMYLENNEVFNEFITTFGIKNDEAIKTLILNLDQKLDLLINKEVYLNYYIDKYYTQENINNYFDSYVNLIKKRISAIKSHLYNLGFEVSAEYINNLEDLLKSLINSNTYEEIKSNCNIKMTNLPNGSSNNAKFHKSEIKNNLDYITNLTFQDKETFINEVFQTKEYSEIIISILKELNKQCNDYKFKINHFEYNDISRFAIKLLKENNKVRDEIRNKYHEIMIDEYQDTNDIQEEFVSLIENNNVYVVGDIKQSIYRFRNANPNLFKQKYDMYKHGLNGYKIDLNNNFRSRNEVLESINNIFNLIMDDEIGNASYREEHQLQYGNLKYSNEGKNNYDNNLSIINYEDNKDFDKSEIESFIIAENIKKKINEEYLVFRDGKLQPCMYKDFTILIDRTSAFDTYKKVFDYYKIPINIYKDDDILQNDETYLIKNIITLILKLKNNIFDNNFKFCFVSIARSYLYDMQDEEIFKIITEHNYKNTEIYIKCKNIANQVDNLSNKQIIYTIISDFDFYMKTILVGDVKYRNIVLNNLLDKAEELNSVGLTLNELENYFNTLIDNNEQIKVSSALDESNSVTLTNIHKSKGLQYNICYYSGLYKEFYLKETSEKFIYSDDYGIILPIYNKGIKRTFLNDLYKEKFIQDEISEKIRLLYVALTRCKEKMIMLTCIDEDKLNIDGNNTIVDYLTRINYRSFQDIIKSIYDKLQNYIVKVNTPDINVDYKLTNVDLSNNYIKDTMIKVNEVEFNNEILTKTNYSKGNSSLYSVEEKRNIDEGIRNHYILENIDFTNPDYSLLNNDEISMVENFLSIPELANINNATIFKEYEFINDRNNKIERGIIDLMLVYKDYIDIIDYKLKNTSDDAYYKQLKGYKNYIENKTNKKTNIYLYSILDKELIKKD